MGGFTDFLFGKKEKASGPYQSQYFQDQEKTLNDLVMGNISKMSPEMMGGSFLKAGQNIPGQMTYQTPNIDFAQRTPYHYSSPASINIPDVYSPQYNMARRSIVDEGARTQEQILNDINSRGMLTSGAANKAVMDLARDQGNRLADLSSQYSIEQGRMGLQEKQLQRELDMQRQLNQAAEIFRQQGASDEQAKFLAQQSLAGYGANLQGRQLATAEEQLANILRRQPMEDLFRMWLQQTGQTGGTQGSPGLIGTVLSNAAGAGANYGLSMI